MIVASIAALAGVSVASAQEQEGKLVNRILKPNMSLVNSAQNKQFVAIGASVDKRAPSKSFCTSDKPFVRSFTAGRAFSPRQFTARHFRAGDETANISGKSQLTKTETVDTAHAAYGNRVAPTNASGLAVVAFAGNRQFLSRGKSQEALSARDTPLTIEQVRELLNKNK